MSEELQNLKSQLESVLFISAEPVMVADLKEVADVPEPDIIAALDALIAEYRERSGGMMIDQVAGGYQMFVNPGSNDLVKRMKGKVRTQKLSVAALETLAIIAYKQPITKAEIEDIRGSNSDGVVKSLLDKRLVKIVGKKEVPGKPMLYSTTREFLQYFGLNDLTELPTPRDLEREDAA